jgi:ribonuclease D
MTKFDGSSKAALLQLSTETECALYDCVALEDNEEFKQFMLKFFADPNIEKIGHSFGSDIRVLNLTFGIELVSNSHNQIIKDFQQHRQHRKAVYGWQTSQGTG